jgi:large subunit ribosomal protein L30
MAKKKQKKLTITLDRSPIGYPKKQKATLKALGLKKVHQTVTLNDNDAVRGMIEKVSHLVSMDGA